MHSNVIATIIGPNRKSNRPRNAIDIGARSPLLVGCSFDGASAGEVVGANDGSFVVDGERVRAFDGAMLMYSSDGVGVGANDGSCVVVGKRVRSFDGAMLL